MYQHRSPRIPVLDIPGEACIQAYGVPKFEGKGDATQFSLYDTKSVPVRSLRHFLGVIPKVIFNYTSLSWHFALYIASVDSLLILNCDQNTHPSIQKHIKGYLNGQIHNKK